MKILDVKSLRDTFSELQFAFFEKGSIVRVDDEIFVGPFIIIRPGLTPLGVKVLADELKKVEDESGR
jgi:hypothetical protein